jgi:hypothetical protein
MSKQVQSEGEARLALHAFMKQSAKNFKKCIEIDDDKLTAATLTDFLAKVKPYYDVSLLLAGYELPEEKEKADDKRTNDV